MRLVEIAPDTSFPAAAAVRIHLLDTVVHTWDVAVTLGDEGYRPDTELVQAVAAVTSRVPAGVSRSVPGGAFAPPTVTTNPDPWAAALAHLGRRHRG